MKCEKHPFERFSDHGLLQSNPLLRQSLILSMKPFEFSRHIFIYISQFGSIKG